ncbi:hypothetical protein BDV97DRAFT_156325 [Delphinella strobiligena]|nr:hypothetical protein BDV97DRAFT_156325 [Delphinella strobiligena]
MAPALWDAAADRQLLLAIIQTTNPSPSWPVIGRMIGKTAESARQHYAKLKKENASTPNNGTDATNGADDAVAANNSDADNNSDPALAPNIKPLQKQAPKRKSAPKDSNKAPPAKRGKKNTITAAADEDEDSEDAKRRPRGSRSRKGSIATATATATKTRVNDDAAMMRSDNDKDNEMSAEGGAINEEDADDVPAPVKTKTRAKKTAPNEPKPRVARTKKTTLAVQADPEDEPDADVAEEDITPDPGMLATYSSRGRSFRAAERKAAFEMQKRRVGVDIDMGLMEEQQQEQEQQEEVLENINVGFEADGYEDEGV